MSRTSVPPLASEVLALLPAADDAPRCSVHAAGIGANPGGTSICADAVALVELPLPWPKPVFASGLLEGLASMMELALGPTRVLAAVPNDDTASNDETRPNTASTDANGISQRQCRVALHWRVGHSTRTFRFAADDAAGIRQLFTHLRQHLPSEPIAENAGFRLMRVTEGERAVLICTQGSHDVCCGTEGSRLATDFAAVLNSNRSPESDDPHIGAPTRTGEVTVYRVSHTGGHRFAPTAMTLPDGRMWAGIEAGELASILDRTADAAELAPHCRGWWGAPTGPAQVGERAVFEHVGWDLDDLTRVVRFRRAASAWNVGISVPETGQAWLVQVTEGRTLPTIACRALGGLPAKPATEFTVRSLREVANT